MNKGFSILVLMLLLLSSFSVLGTELSTDKTDSTDEIPISLWDSIFQSNTFSFADLEKTVVSATANNVVRSANGPYLYVKDQSTAGANCLVGDLISVYVADSNGNKKADIWSHIYVKASSSDVMNLNNPSYGAWVDDFMNSQKTLFSSKVYYGYVCYKPNLQQDRVYSGARCVLGTEYCSNAFQLSGVGAYYCDVVNAKTCVSCVGTTCSNEPVETVSDGLIQTTEVAGLSASLYNIRANGQTNPTVIQGENYQITGAINIVGECKDCVVESGVDYYGQSFSVTTRSSTGACGDDLTVGSKFSAKNEPVIFTLVDKVNRNPGRYKIPVYVFTGCGGTLLAKDTFTITVEKQFEENLVECYWCDGEVKKSGSYANCDDAPKDATDNSALTCEAGTTCYICEDDTIKTGVFESGCVGDWKETQPVCGNEVVTCYSCDADGSSIKDYAKECVGDWKSTPVECKNNEVECWSCSGSSAVPKTVSGTTCPVGSSLNKPNCAVELNTCYWCYDYELKSDFYETSCSNIGLSATEKDCSPTNPVMCYSCDLKGNVVTKQYQTACPSGWSKESVTCGVEETCYWCDTATLQLKSQDYAVCPSGTKDEVLDCSVVEKVDCANNPNEPSCQIINCQAGSTEPFCEALCCDVDGEAKFEYAGLCRVPLATDQCTSKPTNDYVIVLIVVGSMISIVGVMIFLAYGKKKKR